MLRTLWLASWYPSKASSQNGDFIQRHAQAVSRFTKVHVLYVAAYKSTETVVLHQPNLTEEIVYYRKRNAGKSSKIFSFIRYVYLYKKYIEEYIKTAGKPDIVHVHVSMRAGILALWIKRKYRIPYVVTEHWTIFTKERKDNFLKQNFLFRFFVKKIFKNASGVLPVSNNLGENIRQMVADVPFTKVPNVVSDVFHCNTSLQEKHFFTFIHVSSLKEIKNPEGIIRAFNQLLQKYEHVQLRIVGKDFDNLKKYVELSNISPDKIIFTGEITNEEVAQEMQNADAFILFSQSENSPCVIAESLCCGVPVISTNVGGVNESVDETNSILIAPNDEDALVKAMESMMENYSNYNKETISKRAIAFYNYDVVGKQILSEYERVIKDNRPRNFS